MIGLNANLEERENSRAFLKTGAKCTDVLRSYLFSFPIPAFILFPIAMAENTISHYIVLFTAQKQKKFKTWQDGKC
jgi:hypothetical protein